MSITTQTDQMPRDGQFIAYWLIGEAIFAKTFMWDDGTLLAYDTFSDDWIVDHGYCEGLSAEAMHEREVTGAEFLPDADEVWFVQYKN